jgi:hypothetical protein
LYKLVNKIRGFLFAIIIGFSILEIFEKLNPRKKNLLQKEYLYLIEGQEFVLVKLATIIIPTKLES